MTSSSSVVPLRQPDTIEDPLTAILRSGARRLLAQAIEAEADAFLASMKGVQLPDGRSRRRFRRQSRWNACGGVTAWFVTGMARSARCRPALVSMAVESWSNVGAEIYPLRFALVASVAAWRLDGSEVAEIEFDDGIERFGGGGPAEAVG